MADRLPDQGTSWWGATILAAIRKSPLRAAGTTLIGFILASAVIPFFFPGVWESIKSAFGQEPIVYSVRPVTEDPQANPAPSFVIPRAIDGLSPPPINPKARYEWAHDHGGVDSTFSVVRLNLQGRSSSRIILEALRIKVLARRTPIEGSYIVYKYGIGGDIDPHDIWYELDSEEPQVLEAGEWSFPLWISETEIEAFNVYAKTNNYDCDWVMELDYRVGAGKLQSITINDNGKPFRTTSDLNATPYESNDGRTFRKV